MLAPERYSVFLSYLTGWLTTIAWQAATASAFFISANVLQSIVIFNHPEYNPQRWKTTVSVYVVIIVSFLTNTLGAKLLPAFETIVFFVHVLGFVAILIPLVYLGPKGTVHDVFGTFVQEGGWSSKGVTLLVGATTLMYNFIGIESATHMAEEIEGAKHVIPKAIISATTINGVLGFAMLIAQLYVLGDIRKAMNMRTDMLFINIIENAVRSKAAATAMVSICET